MLLEELVFCRNCDAQGTSKDLIKTRSGYFCKSCFDRIYYICPICGKTKKRIYHQSVFINKEGKYINICKQCAIKGVNSGKYRRCALCGYLIAPSAEFSIISEKRGEIFLCPACTESATIRCNKCNKLVLQMETVGVEDQVLCHNCAKNSARECSECGNFYLKQNMVMFKLGNNPPKLLCRKCRYRRVINSYSFRPNPNFLSMPNEDNPIFLGMELEITLKEHPIELLNSSSDDIAQEFEDKFFKHLNSEFYVKFDRSVGNGFEIVTHPMSFLYLRKKFPLKEIIEWLSHYAYEDGNGICGIHFHIDKKSRSPFAFDGISSKEFSSMLAIFFHLNYEKLLIFSDRKNKETIENHCPNLSKSEMKSILNGNYNSDRHRCINFLTPKNTIEIRIFNGTLSYEKIMKYAKFVFLLTYFIRKSMNYNLFLYAFRKNDKKILWNNFLNFLRNLDNDMYDILKKLS